MIGEISELTLLALISVFLIGGIVKGTLGFGLPLATMAMLPLFVPVDFALAVNALVLPFTNVAQFLQMRRMRETALRFRPVLVGIVLGAPAGAVLMTAISDAGLIFSLGVFVLVFIGLSVSHPQLAVPPGYERSIGSVVGVAAGIVGALTTANGPLFVMYLLGMRVDRPIFLSSLSLFFIVSGIIISGAFYFAGLIDAQRVFAAAICLVAAMLGMYLGNAIGSWLPAERFRNVVLVALGVLAINLMIQGASGF